MIHNIIVHLSSSYVLALFNFLVWVFEWYIHSSTKDLTLLTGQRSRSIIPSSDKLLGNKEVFESFHLPETNWEQKWRLHHCPPQHFAVGVLADLTKHLLFLLNERNRKDAWNHPVAERSVQLNSQWKCLSFTLWYPCCLVMYIIWSMRWLRLFSSVCMLSLVLPVLRSSGCSPIWTSKCSFCLAQCTGQLINCWWLPIDYQLFYIYIYNGISLIYVWSIDKVKVEGLMLIVHLHAFHKNDWYNIEGLLQYISVK